MKCVSVVCDGLRYWHRQLVVCVASSAKIGKQQIKNVDVREKKKSRKARSYIGRNKCPVRSTILSHTVHSKVYGEVNAPYIWSM